jgi:hypothetical protein
MIVLRKQEIKAPNSYDWLKVLAIISMIIDHAGLFLMDDNQSMRAIGRLAFPLFFFLIGYNGTTKISASLVGAACFIEAVDYLVQHGETVPLGILCTVIITRIFLKYALSEAEKWCSPASLAVLFACLIILFPLALIFDYGGMALMFAVLGRVAKAGFNNKPRLLFLLSIMIFFVFVTSFDSLNSYSMAIAAMFLGAIFYKFRVVEAKSGNITVDSICLLASRHALFIYVFHYTLFGVLYWYA